MSKNKKIVLLMDGHDDVNAYKTFESARAEAARRYHDISTSKGTSMATVYNACETIKSFNRTSDDHMCEAYMREVEVED